MIDFGPFLDRFWDHFGTQNGSKSDLDGVFSTFMLPRRLHDPTWIDFGTLKTRLKPIFDYTFYDTVSGWILDGFWDPKSY